MMETAIAYTSVEDDVSAGHALGRELWAGLSGPPDALIVFAAPQYAHGSLLRALADECPVEVMIGASSAGEFTQLTQGEGTASALALKSTEIRFRAGVGHNLSEDPAAAAHEMVANFRGMAEPGVHRTALILADALAGHAHLLVDELTLATAGQYQFFGGGAGDNAQFRRTVVFHGSEVLTDAAVALEILSPRPLGIGVSHGWEPASKAFRVTESRGLRLIGLNGLPAVEAFEAHAEQTGRVFDQNAPISFFLHNIIGVDTGAGYRLRVPLAVDSDGAVLCAAEVPAGSLVHIMHSTANSTVLAAERATAAALDSLGGHKPKAALFFDCVATRLRLGDKFNDELDAVKAQLAGIPMVGCNTHGQIARAAGQFEGFHNCTAVVCLLPE
jgi:hypothetical protein